MVHLSLMENNLKLADSSYIRSCKGGNFLERVYNKRRQTAATLAHNSRGIGEQKICFIIVLIIQRNNNKFCYLQT